MAGMFGVVSVVVHCYDNPTHYMDDGPPPRSSTSDERENTQPGRARKKIRPGSPLLCSVDTDGGARVVAFGRCARPRPLRAILLPSTLSDGVGGCLSDKEHRTS